MAICLYDLSGADGARFSPYCWRAKMALAHKGLAFSTQPVAFTEIGHVADGRQKIVPVIEDQGRIVADSFTIAEYLDEQYPDRPSLFEGSGGKATARFVESWAFTALHPLLMGLIVKDIHDLLTDDDQHYFRQSREARLGRSLEEVQLGREGRLAPFHKALEPVRRALTQQPFIGGESPLFADYIICGTLQWAKIAGSIDVLPPVDDPVTDWFLRCSERSAAMARDPG